MEHFNIGDLVQHCKSRRFAIVVSDTYPLYGASVCKVIWSDSFHPNLMDIKMLEKVNV